MHVVEVTDRPTLMELYQTILEPSFPASELEPLESLTRRMLEGSVSIVAVESDGESLAVAITEVLVLPRVVLLTYFAVRADHRGRGIGTRLLQEVMETVRAHGCGLILAEVEHPNHHSPSAARGNPSARLRFYGRAGARVLGLPYFQPELDAASERVYGMLLLGLWIDERLVSADGSRLIDSRIEEALDAILQDHNDAAALALRQAARADSGVLLFDMDDFARAPVATGA